MKKTDGFTLIELVVGILATALVSGAIMTFLLMGLKANRATIDANTDQRNAKIMITMMEKLASEGIVSSVEYIGGEELENRDWTLFDENKNILLSFSGARGSLLNRDGTSMMDRVLSSNVELNTATLPGTGCLLTFAVETAAGTYETSVFCRSEEIKSNNLDDSNIIPDSEDDLPSGSDAATSRVALISKLASQLGSTGYIGGTDTPYSLWYCLEEGYTGYPSGWNKNTPWCACFVSWAINDDNVSAHLNAVPREANVDTLWGTFDDSQTIHPDTALENVLPGDLIFFDWNGGSTESKTDLEHVGVVLFIDETSNLVYTIEGNSGGIVALRRYSVDDPTIYGYGRLNWK